VFGYTVVNSYPHDARAFTQGLIYRDGFLFESTGLHGRSTLRKVRLETGEVLQPSDIDAMYFGEGLTDWNDTLIQLTWQTNIGFVYDLASFRRKATFGYRGAGWGLTHDSRQLIMSDGTSTLRFLDPATFKEIRRITVGDSMGPVDDLNDYRLKGGRLRARLEVAPRAGVAADAVVVHRRAPRRAHR
jgi:glutamine cyclotransferase